MSPSSTPRDRSDAPLAEATIAPQPASRLEYGDRRKAVWLDFGLRVVRIGPALILVVLFTTMALLSPFFMTERNLQNLVVQAAPLAVLAVGQLLAILTRGIDLSVGSLLALCTVTGALVAESSAGGNLTVILTMLGTGAAVGLVNGVLFVKGRLPHPFIVTLATLSAASGLALVLTKGEAIPGMPSLVDTLARDQVGVIPVPALVALGVGAIGFVLTRKTQWGRWVYAIGGNPEAANRAGIPVDRILLTVYALVGVSAAIAAILVAGRIDAGSPTAGRFAELDAISAVIIGGASFLGGRGGVSNALIGALAIATIRNGLNLLGVDANYQLIAIGAVLVAAVQIDVLRSGLEDRLKVRRAKEAGVV